ncbi:unnamed protein product [Scytosiphon promiscuus]
MSSPSRKRTSAAVGILGITAVALLAYGRVNLAGGRWCLARCSSATEEEAGFERRLTLSEDAGLEVDSSSSPSLVASGELPKTAFSSKTRMVFPVGLEGTGHHFMNHALDEMCLLDGVSCLDTCALAKALYWEMATPVTAFEYRVGLEALRTEVEALALAANATSDETVSLLTFGRCEFNDSKVGMMSFPNFGGDDKPLQYVDVRTLAEEAERVGIDLRLVYLGRSAKDILTSDTGHRYFGGGFTHEARVLINNAAVVDSSLHELHPDFVTCFSYDMIADPAQASRVARFAVPTEKVAASLEKTLLETVRVRPLTEAEDGGDEGGEAEDEQDAEGRELMSGRLQEKLDQIERDRC